MEATPPIPLECYYEYGYRGRTMLAVRAPFATINEAPDLVGRRVLAKGSVWLALGVSRQITGPIAKGEPIGLEVRRLGSDERTS